MSQHETHQGPQAAAPLNPPASFTERELEIVTLIVDGLSNRSIGERLQISPRTVQAHIASAMRKARVNTRTQLAVGVLRDGIVLLVPRAVGPPVVLVSGAAA